MSPFTKTPISIHSMHKSSFLFKQYNSCILTKIKQSSLRNLSIFRSQFSSVPIDSLNPIKEEDGDSFKAKPVSIITTDFTLRDLTKDDVTINFARSSGPGGQNVNKVNTKVDMRLNLDKSNWIPNEIRDQIKIKVKGKVNKDNELVITSTKHRTQMKNIENALDKMNKIIQNTVDEMRPVEIDPKKKKKIEKQSHSLFSKFQIKIFNRKKISNEKRLKNKKFMSLRKSDRRNKDWS